MASDMTAEQAEQYVREHWDSCDVEDHRLCCGGLAWRPVIEPHWSAWCDTASKAWLSAAEYTCAHEQKIAEVRDEIDFLNFAFSVQDRNEDRAIVARILVREQAALDELLRGWRQK